MGGLTSDVDDGEEKVDAQESKETVREAREKIRSLAGIVETEGYVHPSAHRPSSKPFKKTDIKVGSLPDTIRANFKTDFAPALLDYVGTIAAWTDPSAAETIQLFNVTFPEYKLSIDDPHDEALVLAVVKLSKDKIEGWRNKFAKTAIAILKALFKDKTPAEIRETVEYYLQGTERDYTFYYREVVPDPESDGIKLKGIFQSHLCSRVLGAHCAATSDKGTIGPIAFKATEVSTRPAGALVLACQAIKRGLNYFRTGTLVIPKAPLGNFSKNNWADHDDFSQGVRTTIPSTSAISAVVKKLDAARWDKIILAARAAAVARDTDNEPAVDVDSVPAEEDFELLDDDSD
ncbi:hypothetical protein B0H16DRAFT_1788005 [Mycena metata]|uniref:DUF6532 domain-containing protein n=1 Tax=Mycena metata TaxID=1033252 RepID=A0AAD7HLC5_9AGAR|nr:hypothetical protein B0H16DRAFT_1788005 [Mycena metata]